MRQGPTRCLRARLGRTQLRARQGPTHHFRRRAGRPDSSLLSAARPDSSSASAARPVASSSVAVNAAVLLPRPKLAWSSRCRGDIRSHAYKRSDGRSTHHSKRDSPPRRRTDELPTARHARSQRDSREGVSPHSSSTQDACIGYGRKGEKVRFNADFP
eukprot:3651333-Pleurochrysis_carterae.AAC.2